MISEAGTWPVSINGLEEAKCRPRCLSATASLPQGALNKKIACSDQSLIKVGTMKSNVEIIV